MPDKCPVSEQLLAYALGGSDEPAAETVERHVATCDTCRTEVMTLRHAVRELRAQASGAGPSTDQCLDEFAIIDLAEGAVDGWRRAQLVAHVAACPRCRNEVAAVSRLLAQPAIKDESAKVTPSPWRSRKVRVAGIGAGLAAAAVLLLFVAGPSDVEGPSTVPHRGPVLTVSVPPAALAPAGVVGSPTRLVWTSVPRADRYEVTVLGSEGSIVWEALTPDTSVAIPNSLMLRAGSPYFWKVRARTGFDRWAESDLVEFTLTVPSDSVP